MPKQKPDRWQYFFAGLSGAIASMFITRNLVDREEEWLLYEIVFLVVFAVFYFAAIYAQTVWKRKQDKNL